MAIKPASLSRLLPKPVRSLLRKSIRAKRITDRLTGGKVSVGDTTILAPGRFKEWYGTFEPLTMQWIEQQLLPGMTAVNVGAHIGFVAARMAQLVGPDGRVVALEPAPENLRYLRRNLKRYADRAEIIPAAVGRAAGFAVLKLTGSSDSHGLYDHPLTSTVREMRVELVALDDVVHEPDLVTIDVEGAELEVLAGMKQILSRMPPLLLEWAPACQVAAGRSADEIAAVLDGFGYKLRVLDDVHGVERSIDEVRGLLQERALPANWYGNIACTKQQ